MSTEQWNYCSSNTHNAVVLILSITTSAIILPIMLIIMYSFIKMDRKLEDKNKTSMFKTTLFYFMTSILFYISYPLELINNCYAKDHKLHNLLILSVTSFYSLHVLLLILLLFTRLYFVFQSSSYRLSKCCVYFFIFLCIVGIIDALIFIYFFVFNHHKQFAAIFYFIGTLLIVLTTIWVISLYIYKLFRVIRGSYVHRHRKESLGSIKKDPLIQIISKYTILAIICVITACIFWSVAVFWPRPNWFLYKIFWHLFLWIDVTANVLCFTAGFSYMNEMYLKICGCLDRNCRICCGNLVLLSLGQDLRNVTKLRKNQSQMSELPSHSPESLGDVTKSYEHDIIATV